MINYGIALPQTSPFVYYDSESEGDTIQELEADLGSNQAGISELNQQEVEGDHILNHTFTFPLSQTFSSDILASPPSMSRTGPLSDDHLDHLILQLRGHYTRAGITMLDGMLRRLGYHIPREAIRQSLLRIDPVQRVFERIRIRRRTYSVPGPNSLWHHDGQHGTFYSYYLNFLLSNLSMILGLIRWGIVIHAFIDGYSRLITAIQASDNNRGETVLSLFLQAAGQCGVSSRLRDDHGVENISVAAWMESFRGVRRGSYIWGR